MTALANHADFTAAEIAQLADDYAVAKAAFDEAKKRLEDLAKLVKDSGRAELIGRTFRLDVDINPRTNSVDAQKILKGDENGPFLSPEAVLKIAKTVDAKAAAEMLTKEQFKLVASVSDVTTIKVKPAVKLVVVA